MTTRSHIPTDTVMPVAPRTLQDSGLSFELVHQVVTKTLHFAGEMMGTELAARLGVPFTVLEPCVELLKHERHVEVVGGSFGPQSFSFRLTDNGHQRASVYVQHSPYAGKLPVPLAQYTAYMRAFGRRNDTEITRASVRETFRHLILAESVLDQLGPGIAARHSLFVYGPPGNGKTVIAHTIVNLLGGNIAIPHAIAVDTEIIRLFDPLIHQEVDPAEPDPGGLVARMPVEDGRWVRCKRPVVAVGGELRMESLELGYSSISALYRVPMQALANGGVLVIDDFGRQRASPREMLNRWIVPLESRVDHLVLQTGQKFELPFETFVVFATNLNPHDLLDESFLRRIRYKVYAESPTHEEFTEIFHNCCRERGLAFDPQVVQGLIAKELEPRRVPLRGCQPRDLIDQALSLASYNNEPRVLTPPLLSAACKSYFLADSLDAAE